MNIFKALAHALGKVAKKLFGLSKLIAKTFTEEQLDLAIAIVKEAAEKFTNNAQRKTYAAHWISAKTGLPDHLSNLLLELAVTQLKHAGDAVFQEVDDALDGHDVIQPGEADEPITEQDQNPEIQDDQVEDAHDTGEANQELAADPPLADSDEADPAV